MSDTIHSKYLSIYAWFVTAFNMLVIAWGAMVRATGSGAGCGSHWPQCNGAIIPELVQIETVIEFSHRVSSALAGIFVVILVVWVLRRSENVVARRAAVGSFVFIVLEGLLGALLVRLELVAGDTSVLRAGMVALHLVNTLLLLTMLGLTARFSRLRPGDSQRSGYLRWLPHLLAIGLIATAILSAAGAVTALGDTLFPAQSLAAGLNTDLDPSANFLVRLRVVHPFIAVLTSAYLLALNQYMRRTLTNQRTVRLANLLTGLVVIQLVAGVVNVALLAPLWMQVLHLILADSVWLTLIMLIAENLWIPATHARQPVTTPA
jgi:cytochrome c oxidase assembly protein subunit 15